MVVAEVPAVEEEEAATATVPIAAVKDQAVAVLTSLAVKMTSSSAQTPDAAAAVVD